VCGVLVVEAHMTVSAAAVSTMKAMRFVIFTTALSLAAFHTSSTTIWPQPLKIENLGESAIYLEPDFRINLLRKASSEAIEDAISRYFTQITNLPNFGRSLSGENGIHSLIVGGDLVVEKVSVEMDESYDLIVSESSASLNSSTFFGMLRGLESVLQMLERDDVYDIGEEPPFFPNAVSIQDSPRFSYRGLMMDLSRHYYALDFLRHVIDSLVLNKMNVLHLHITDDQSFPMQSLKHPELTEKGSFGTDFVYTIENISSVIEYAFQRGVVIVPEFDMPAHSSSWGAGEPNIVVTGYPGCSPKLFTHGDTLDPTKNETYDLIRSFLSEMVSSVFRSERTPYLHLGGDEVPTLCWLQSDHVVSWMKDRGYNDTSKLESYFVDRVASEFYNDTTSNSSATTLMYWEEVFNNGCDIRQDAIIQAWKSNVMPDVLKSGRRVTNSYKWYALCCV
jgi:hexosaminidase